jgi:hypothetical protein
MEINPSDSTKLKVTSLVGKPAAKRNQYLRRYRAAPADQKRANNTKRKEGMVLPRLIDCMLGFI